MKKSYFQKTFLLLIFNQLWSVAVRFYGSCQTLVQSIIPNLLMTIQSQSLPGMRDTYVIFEKLVDDQQG